MINQFYSHHPGKTLCGGNRNYSLDLTCYIVEVCWSVTRCRTAHRTFGLSRSPRTGTTWRNVLLLGLLVHKSTLTASFVWRELGRPPQAGAASAPSRCSISNYISRLMKDHCLNCKSMGLMRCPLLVNLWRSPCVSIIVCFKCVVCHVVLPGQFYKSLAIVALVK